MTRTFDGRWEAQVVIDSSNQTITATNGSGGPSTCTIPAGSYWLSDTTGGNAATGLITAIQTALNTGRPSGWTVSLASSLSGAGRVTITGSGTWSITFSGEIGTILGYSGSPIVGPGSQLSDTQCVALWFPDCPLSLNNGRGDPRQFPIVTDARSIVSPDGTSKTLAGNSFYRHRAPRYSHVPVAQMWEGNVSLACASFENWAKVTQLGAGGFTTFGPGTPFQIWDHTGQEVGSNYFGGPFYGWTFSPALVSLEQDMAEEGYTGLWNLQLPDIISKG